MASPVPESPHVRFGPYELDLSAGKLLKEGIPLKLQPQPFRVLVLLISRPGQVITREEIQRHLWGDSIFVDFEHGINFSINQIRAVLCDNAEKPRYIETLPRVGYRFLGTLEPSNRTPAKAAALTYISAIHVVPSIDQTPTSTAARATWRNRVPLFVFPLVLGLAALAVAAGIFFFKHRATLLTENDTIVLADFDNRTGDAIFDQTLQQGLAIQLRQSPFLNIFPDDGMRETLRYMGRSPDEPVTTAIGREICERRGIKALLAGSISILGNNYVLTLEARDCHTGAPLAQEQVEVQSKEQVLRALGNATSKLRAQLGESLSSIQKFDAPIEQATTGSLAALQAYSLGKRALYTGADVWDGVPFFKRAIELDSNFAMAYAALGELYSGSSPIGNDDLSAAYLKKAFDLRDRVSEREKLYITSTYYDSVTRELDKAIDNYEVWKWTYPGDAEPYDNSAGLNIVMGQYQKAVENAQKAIDLRPDRIFAYERLATAYGGLNRLNDAQAICNQAVAQKLDGPRTHWRMYTIAFLQNEPVGMQRELEWAKNTGQTTRPLLYQAMVAAYLGKLQQSRGLFAQTIENRQADRDAEGAALATIQLAVVNALFGYGKQATVQVFATADTLPTDKDLASLTLALAGNFAKAREMMGESQKRFPHDTLLKNVHAPSVYAVLEMNRNNPDQAIELLKSALPYELGNNNQGWGLLPIYLRGQAYLQKRAGNEAAAEFQKIIDHRGGAPFSPLHALARLGRARADALQGHTTKSRSEYQDFFTMWKDADSEIPILVQAKAEYQKLN